jgi:hypothetical protein
MRAVALFFSLLSFQSLVWAESCGRLELVGLMKFDGLDHILITRTATQSQEKWKMPASAHSKLFGHPERIVRAVVTVTKPSDGTFHEVESLESVELAVPDPARRLNRLAVKYLETKACLPN